VKGISKASTQIGAFGVQTNWEYVADQNAPLRFPNKFLKKVQIFALFPQICRIMYSSRFSDHLT
jgi:hypothetical protein